jgi:hypothetical protein
LKKCGAPASWGDEEANFLTSLVIQNDFLDDSKCFLSAKERTRRSQSFAALSMEADGKLFLILQKLDKLISARIARKGNVSLLWLVVTNFALRNQELQSLEKSAPSPWRIYSLPRLREEVDSFWTSKADKVASDFSALLGEKITAKIVEKARRAIRATKPFSFPPSGVKK